MVHLGILGLRLRRHDGLSVGSGLEDQEIVLVLVDDLLDLGLLALGIGSLLLARICSEGAEDLDLSPFLDGWDRLGLGLEEMEGLAVPLC